MAYFNLMIVLTYSQLKAKPHKLMFTLTDDLQAQFVLKKNTEKTF